MALFCQLPANSYLSPPTRQGLNYNSKQPQHQHSTTYSTKEYSRRRLHSILYPQYCTQQSTN
eukprot:scaffold12265_cov94-Skeletonema_dohrnii-CCMP3373.AAC.4